VDSADFIETLLAPYRPRLPLPHLVVEVNRIYHAFEARDYDSRHPEVHRQLPALWHEMVGVALAHLGDVPWRVLNIGCGTGFEAGHLLRNLPPGRLEHLTCYDPSPEMLARCRATIGPRCPQAVFTSEARDLRRHTYNVLATNSLLHHLPAPVALSYSLLPLLDRGAVWLAGHEPSQRFHLNPACVAAHTTFLRERRWRKFLSPTRYVVRMRQALGLASDPPRQTAREAWRRGLFERPPTASAIGLLVDFHVAHSGSEAAAGRGFDLHHLQQQMQRAWQRVWHTTYGFMGPWYEGDLPPRWQRTSRDLARRYPDDGANFCTVWRRTL
jgi:SAM-dependent methyltransferase